MLLSSVCGALLQIMVLHPALGEPVEATPPVAVDTPVPNSGLERFTEPQLLSNGTTFLEIWRTEHVTYLDSYDTPSGVSFRLFSADGDALVPLHDGDLDTAAADWMTAARLGEDYYVLWNATDTDYSAKAARVDGETGEILETKEVAFAGAPDLGVQKVDAILPGEGDALLLWQSGGIYAAVLDPATLELQGEEPTLLSSVPGGYGPWLATARSGDRILVGYGVCEETGYYQYECAVYADLFDLETNSLVSSFLIDEYAFDGLSSHPTTSLSVGEDGERFVLLWMLYGASDIPTLWGYSAITHVLDAQTGALLNESSLEEFPQQPRCDKAMARIGDRYMAACTGWEAEDGETVAVDSLLLDRETGALLSEKSVVSSDSAFRFGSPMAEVSGDRFLVAWQEEGEDPSGGGILGAFVDVDGGVDAADGGMTVAERNNSEIRPAIAASGGNALVVWMDGRNPEWEDFDIYGVRVDPEGVPLDPDAIPIGTGAGDQREPAVASNGSDYLVVWQAVSTASASASGLWGALVDGGTGELVPGGAFEIPTAYEGRNPRAAARPGGDRFLVTFDDIRHEEDNSWTYGVFGVWVDAASGAILSPEPFLVGQTDDATNGDLVWTGSRYLSVFLNRSGSDVNVNAFLVDAAETPAEADALFVGEGAETYSTYPPPGRRPRGHRLRRLAQRAGPQACRVGSVFGRLVLARDGGGVLGGRLAVDRHRRLRCARGLELPGRRGCEAAPQSGPDQRRGRRSGRGADRSGSDDGGLGARARLGPAGVRPGPGDGAPSRLAGGDAAGHRERLSRHSRRAGHRGHGRHGRHRRYGRIHGRGHRGRRGRHRRGWGRRRRGGGRG